MEQVFDFREFILNILKRYKLILILGLVFLLLGGLFGAVKSNEEQYMTTYTANVNIVGGQEKADLLTGTMKNITAILESDYFYNNIVHEIKTKMTSGEFKEIFNSSKELSIDEIKDVIVLHTQGNIILIDITSTDPELTKEACEIGINYIVSEVSLMLDNVTVKALGNQTVNLAELKGETMTKNVILFGILGLIGGIGIGVISIFFSEVFDLKVKSAEDLKRFNIPVLGEIRK